MNNNNKIWLKPQKLDTKSNIPFIYSINLSILVYMSNIN